VDILSVEGVRWSCEFGEWGHSGFDTDGMAVGRNGPCQWVQEYQGSVSQSGSGVS